MTSVTLHYATILCRAQLLLTAALYTSSMAAGQRWPLTERAAAHRHNTNTGR